MKKLTIFLIIILEIGFQRARCAIYTICGFNLLQCRSDGEQNNTYVSLLFRQQYAGFKDVTMKDGKTVSDNTSPQQILLNMETYSQITWRYRFIITKDKIGYYNNIMET